MKNAFELQIFWKNLAKTKILNYRTTKQRSIKKLYDKIWHHHLLWCCFALHSLSLVLDYWTNINESMMHTTDLMDKILINKLEWMNHHSLLTNALCLMHKKENLFLREERFIKWKKKKEFQLIFFIKLNLTWAQILMCLFTGWIK